MAQKLQIHTSISKLNETNMYLVEAPQSRHATLIDPSDSAVACQWIEAKKLKLDYILLTHEHYDHIAALNEIRGTFSAEVIASAACSKGIQKPEVNFSKFFNLVLDFKLEQGTTKESYDTIDPYIAEKAERTFKDSLELDWQGHRFQLWNAPGHSKGSILIEIDQEILFSGDTISYEYELITGFPGGSKRQYRDVTKPLLQSFDETMQVYPGHGRSFLLGEATIV